jgi:glutaredoxin
LKELDMTRRIYAIALLGLSIGTAAITVDPVAISAKPRPVEVSVSDGALAELALHLKKINAKMYGAYWCPHCTHQKEMFGKTAIQSINYIECDPRGANAKPSLCKAAKVTGYPTWEINGKQYVGVQSLEELAKLSGYKGSTKF